jgi:glycosyltransferase involved in cell wall biosynthesis
MDNLKFSIITVCYNAENFIEDTIKSVINQKHNNYEYVIIDGESTDNTLKIINSYKDKIDVIVSEPDKGIYDAMNKGLKLAQGEFLNFLNAGDTFCSNNILRLIEKRITGNIKIISGDFNLINSNTGLNNHIKTEVLTIKKLKRDFKACHQSIFVSKDICDEYNLSYNIRADYLWVIEAVLKTSIFQTQKINLPIVNYIQEGSSFLSFWKSLEELILIQKKKFKFQIIFNLDIYLYKIIRHLKNEINFKKIWK